MCIKNVVWLTDAVLICVRNFDNLIPDAPELIHDFLVNEKDASCKRNAFMMLIHADQVCRVFPVCKYTVRFLSQGFIVHFMSDRIELWIT